MAERTFYKQAGRCPGCQRDCRVIRTTYPDGPMQGEPRHLGDVTEIGTQVRMLLWDGSTTDLTFCVDCANQIGPEDYTAIWNAQLDYTARVWAQNQAPYGDPAAWAKARRTDLAYLMARPIVARWAAVTTLPDLHRETIDRRVVFAHG